MAPWIVAAGAGEFAKIAPMIYPAISYRVRNQGESIADVQTTPVWATACLLRY